MKVVELGGGEFGIKTCAAYMPSTPGAVGMMAFGLNNQISWETPDPWRRATWRAGSR